jgi:selenoprotein W-related protein
LTEKVLKQYKRKLESLTLIPSDGGRFELSVDGEQIYSKLQTGRFPDEDEMLEEIGKRLAPV